MKINKTWWGEKFVTALEGFIDPGRLQRGRAYRTDRRILSFKIDRNTVTAKVRGNINPYFGVTREPRYNITLKFKTVSAKAWKDTVKKICTNPARLSKLMLNELPEDINDAFEGNTGLLPATFKDIKAECDCPDYENPCKHIAGVYYRISEMLDSNPMLLFSLRGIEPNELQKELKKSDLGKAFADHLSVPSDVSPEFKDTLFLSPVTNSSRKKVNLHKFWCLNDSIDAELSEKDEEEGKYGCVSIIKKQGDYPPFWDKHSSFIDAMQQFYEYTNRKNNKNIF
jgi:uncharacterized Zn finger protein